jgi:F0F1-type ATP synthase assembly protein I
MSDAIQEIEERTRLIERAKVEKDLEGRPKTLERRIKSDLLHAASATKGQKAGALIWGSLAYALAVALFIIACLAFALAAWDFDSVAKGILGSLAYYLAKAFFIFPLVLGCAWALSYRTMQNNPKFGDGVATKSGPGHGGASS